MEMTVDTGFRMGDNCVCDPLGLALSLFKAYHRIICSKWLTLTLHCRYIKSMCVYDAKGHLVHLDGTWITMTKCRYWLHCIYPEDLQNYVLIKLYVQDYQNSMNIDDTCVISTFNQFFSGSQVFFNPSLRLLHRQVCWLKNRDRLCQQNGMSLQVHHKFTFC